MEFVKAFNAQTQSDAGTDDPGRDHGLRGPLVHVHHQDAAGRRADQQAIGIEKGSGEPNRDKVGTITEAQVREIAEKKLADLNAHDVDQAAKIIAGTARSMGVEVVDVMAKHGKRYLEARAKVDREHEYAPAEAIALVKELKRAKFDESVEVHVRTGLNVRHADEQLRGTIALPARPRQGRQRSPSSPRATRRARPRRPAPTSSAPRTSPSAIQEGFTDFDVAIATPDLMPVVGRLGRILGPQGKMPNPKVGTVTMDVAKAVEESKAGKVEYRTDRTAIVHLVDRQDRRSTSEQLLENYAAVIEELIRAKPSAAKGKLHPLDHARLDAWAPASRSTRRDQDLIDIVEEAAPAAA